MECEQSVNDCKMKLSKRLRRVIFGLTFYSRGHIQYVCLWLFFFYPPPSLRVSSPSEQAVKQMREAGKQMLQKITDNDEQWEKAKEEVTQVVAQHSDTQARLREQEQLTFMEEQRARVSDIMCTCRLYPAWLTVCKKSSRDTKMLPPVLSTAPSMLHRERWKTLWKSWQSRKPSCSSLRYILQLFVWSSLFWFIFLCFETYD